MEGHAPRSPAMPTNGQVGQVGDHRRIHTPHQRGVLTIGHDPRGRHEAASTPAGTSALITPSPSPLSFATRAMHTAAAPPSPWAGLLTFGQNSLQGSGTAAPTSLRLLSFGERARQLSGWDKGDQPYIGGGASTSTTAISTSLPSSSTATSSSSSTMDVSTMDVSTMDVSTMDIDITRAPTARNISGQHVFSSIRSGGVINGETSVAVLGPASSTLGASFVLPGSTVAVGENENGGPSILARSHAVEAVVAAKATGNASRTSAQVFSDAAALSAPNGPSGTKLCGICGGWKPRDQWHKKEWKKSGECIACVTLENNNQARQRAEEKKAVKAAKAAALQVAQKKAKEKQEQARKQNEEIEKQKLAAPTSSVGVGVGVGGQEVARPQAFQPQAPTWPMTLRGASNDHGRPEFSVVQAQRRLGVTHGAAVTQEARYLAAGSDSGRQSPISAEPARAKRVRDDVPTLLSFETPDKTHAINLKRNSKYMYQQQRHSPNASVSGQPWLKTGTKRRVETEASTSTDGSGAVESNGDKPRGSDDGFSFGQPSTPNVYSVSTKRVRRGDALQIAPHGTMVAARQKFQIKHHESLPRQEGSTFPALEHSPSLGSDTSVASVRSSSWAATVGGVRPQFRVQHHPTTGKGRFVSLSHELPLPREHTSPGGRPPLLSGQTTAVNKSTPLVVIDGSNVAFAHRVDIFNPLWSPQGILLSLRYFRDRDVAAVAFVPRPRVDGMNPSNEHKKAILEAVKKNEVSLVPTQGNDDVFILSYAIERNAHIVTNDQFRDHGLNPETLRTLGLGKRQLDAYLTNFRICYTFTRDEFIPNPEASLIKALTRLAVGKS